ncbi:MAG: regulatory protein RecX [Victivallaceae bacterium]|nr:regulatory protein RecX [Victivallaceae bacterium]
MGNNDVLKKAYDLLARRAHSAQELRNKLYKRKFASRDIETVISECKRLGLLDDSRFADDYAAELSGRGQGPFKIKMKLREKGLSETNIEKVLHTITDNEYENARRALAGKLRGLFNEPDMNKRRQKACRFLAYRGFSSDVISRLMENTPELKP